MNMKDFNELDKAREDAKTNFYKCCVDVFEFIADGMSTTNGIVKKAIDKAKVAELAYESANRDFFDCLKREAHIATLEN